MSIILNKLSNKFVSKYSNFDLQMLKKGSVYTVMYFDLFKWRVQFQGVCTRINRKGIGVHSFCLYNSRLGVSIELKPKNGHIISLVSSN